MNIAVDYGNTSAKAGIFENNQLVRKEVFLEEMLLRAFVEGQEAECVIVSSVSRQAEEMVNGWRTAAKKIVLNPQPATAG